MFVDKPSPLGYSNGMLTELQTIILTCLLGPEDPGAFKREQGRLRKAEQRLVNPEPSRAANKRYAAKNPEKCRKTQQVARVKQFKRDPAKKLAYLLRDRLRKALGGGPKTRASSELLGCSVQFWRGHLESLFKPGMTWENYGPVWHIDHIKPCAAFNLIDPEQQKACFNWSNTQPLLAVENLKKGDKYVG